MGEVAQYVVSTVLIALGSILFLSSPVGTMVFGEKRWSASGKHCVVTGGSQGLGLELAKLLAARGATVTIVARDEKKLQTALDEIRKASSIPPEAHAYIAQDVSTFAGAESAISIASSRSAQRSSTGPPASVVGCPDVVFCCAGAALPGFFLDTPEETFERALKLVYWTALSTSHASASKMAAEGKKGKIVFVSSLLGFTGLIGYSSYSPVKHAIKGLAESLRSELSLYSIDVHCHFPSGILSPGYETENKTKPAITKKIEESDAPLTALACAKGLLQGVERGDFFITTDFNAELLRCATAGAAPGNGFWPWERLKGFIGLIAFPLWRTFAVDGPVKQHRRAHYDEYGSKLGLPSLKR